MERYRGNPGIGASMRSGSQVKSKSLAIWRGFCEADGAKLAFQLFANKPSQANQSGSQQSQSSGLRNGRGDDGIAAGERHGLHKAVLACIKGQLHRRAAYGLAVVPRTGNRPSEFVAN